MNTDYRIHIFQSNCCRGCRGCGFSKGLIYFVDKDKISLNIIIPNPSHTFHGRNLWWIWSIFCDKLYHICIYSTWQHALFTTQHTRDHPLSSRVTTGIPSSPRPLIGQSVALATQNSRQRWWLPLEAVWARVKSLKIYTLNTFSTLSPFSCCSAVGC